MYKTTTESQQKSSVNSGSGESAFYFSLASSYTPRFFQGRKGENDSSGDTQSGFSNYLSYCAFMLMALALCSVIVLWTVALIVDGPDEMTSCVALWPLVVSVLVIAFIFIALSCVDYCWKRNPKNVQKSKSQSSLVIKDSLNKKQEPQVEDITDNFVPYEQNMCIILSYIVLILTVFCIMISSVVQYFSLSSECYQHLEDTVIELLLGYQVLAFTSIVVLSIIGCFLMCLLLAIVINCCHYHKNTGVDKS